MQLRCWGRKLSFVIGLMLTANAKIAPQGSVFVCLWETVTIFRDFQHTNFGSAEFFGKGGETLKKYAAQNFIVPAGGSLG